MEFHLLKKNKNCPQWTKIDHMRIISMKLFYLIRLKLFQSSQQKLQWKQSTFVMFSLIENKNFMQLQKCNFIIKINLNICLGRKMKKKLLFIEKYLKCHWGPSIHTDFPYAHSNRIPRDDPNINSLIDSPIQRKNIPFQLC